ncbi:hypothetical protein GT002_35510 [Streptomyces sp. SID4917]|nr:hypothetical protein [Streptomyces sp. SID4917]
MYALDARTPAPLMYHEIPGELGTYMVPTRSFLRYLPDQIGEHGSAAVRDDTGIPVINLIRRHEDGRDEVTDVVLGELKQYRACAGLLLLIFKETRGGRSGSGTTNQGTIISESGGVITLSGGI